METQCPHELIFLAAQGISLYHPDYVYHFRIPIVFRTLPKLYTLSLKATYPVIVLNLWWKAKKNLILPNEIMKAKMINCYTFWIMYFLYTNTL